MLRLVAITSKDHEDVTKAYTVIKPGAVKKKLKVEDLGDLGTSKGAVTTDW